MLTASRASRARRAAAPASRGLRLDVQGLRAVAVLAVIADHAGLPLFSGGYVGVDVFFVLSGFLITGLLLRECERTGRVNLVSFYARRARRILPAATLVLVATVAVVAVALSYRAVQRVSTDAGWAAAFLANVHFSRLDTDYFSTGLPPSPLQHYWSLSVEEQFYLLWPPLLVLVLWVQRRRHQGSPHGLDASRLLRRAVAITATVVVVASLAWSVAQTHTDAAAAYFSSTGRAWELAVGALLAVALPLLRGLGPRARSLLGLGGLLAVGVAVVGFDSSTPFPGLAAVLPVLGTAALVAAGSGEELGVSRALSVRPLVWLGDLSYSLYLWHWPVLVLWAETTGAERGPLETIAVLLAVLGLSVLSFRLVEDPVRRGRWWVPRPRRDLVLWPVAAAMVVTAVLGARGLAGERLEQRLEGNAEFAALRTDDRPVGRELARSLRLADQTSPVAFPLTDLADVDALSRDLWNHEYSCWVSHDRSTARTCPVGDPDGDRTVVVLGDSHAGQWLPAVDALGRQHGYRVIPFIKYGCVPYDVPQLTEGGTRPYSECDDFRRWVVEELSGLRPDVVYVGSRSMPPNMVAPPSQRPDAWTAGVGSFLARLGEVVPDVRVLGDTSPLDFDPIDCLTDPEASMAACTAEETGLVREANLLTRTATADAGAHYLPLERLVCRAGRCPAFAGGRMVRANFDHVSVDWARHVVPAFMRLDSPLL